MDWLNPTYGWWIGAVLLAALGFWWADRKRRDAMAQFGGTDLVQRLAASVHPRRRHAKAALTVVALGVLVVALAGPRFGTSVRTVERKGVDLVVALDVSQSMQAEDVAPSRLARAKNEIKRLLDRLSGDRVGLVLFAGDGFVQCPLTTDYDAVRLFLDVAEPDLMPTPGTSFHAAVDAAVKAFDTARLPGDTTRTPGQTRSRALLVVSDGENHVGDLDDIKQTARDARIHLFAAGVGETEGAVIPIYRNGRRVGVKEDRRGRVVRTRLQEDVLTDLVDRGAYFRIARTSSALVDFQESINQLERTPIDAERFDTYEEMFQWPLAVGLILLVSAWAIPVRHRESKPVLRR